MHDKNLMRRFAAALFALAVVLGLSVATPAQATHDWSRASVERANSLKGMPPVTWDKAKKKYVGTINGGGPTAQLFTLQYFYEGMGQSGMTSGGCQANFEIPNPKPTLDTGAGDAHTLAEIACKKQANSQWQVVEVGWNIDQALYGDTNPHLFVGSWVNGVFKGYNAAAGSGWNDYAPNATNVGATLTSGDIWQFRLQYNSSGTVGWWVWGGKWNGSSYVGDWLGHWASTHWTGASPTVTTFTGNTDAQYFWEVLGNSATPCTDMGNATLGTFGPPAAGNWIGSTTNISGPASSNAGFDIPSGYTGYNHVLSGGTNRTARGGGPGSC